MRVSILKTADGSHSLIAHSERGQEQAYHSKRGAIQESMHVFIQAGLNTCGGGEIRILEVGFGTGLNALLTLIAAQSHNQIIHYHAVEPFPISLEVVSQLNYSQILDQDSTLFNNLHRTFTNVETVSITPQFHLYPYRDEVQDLHFPQDYFDLVYFDAFSPKFQPELWEQSNFQKVLAWMKPGGILVTYCAQSVMQRVMRAAGFQIEKLPGSPGKREMVRARKPS